MTELKTLKDLEDEQSDYGYGNEIYVRRDELKAEAIKWVKFYSGEYKLVKKYGYKYNKSKIVRMWMKFFNLTEEDLK